jgi:hypothetical protein
MTLDLHEKVAMAGVGEKGDAAGWLQRPVTTEVRAAWLAERLRYLEVTGERRRHAPPPSFSLSLSPDSSFLYPCKDEDSEQQAEEETSGLLSMSLVGAADAPFPGDGSEASLFPPSLSLSLLSSGRWRSTSPPRGRRGARGEEGEAGGAEDIGGGRLR